jgi:hypothetical protein
LATGVEQDSKTDVVLQWPSKERAGLPLVRVDICKLLPEKRVCPCLLRRRGHGVTFPRHAAVQWQVLRSVM